MLNLAIRESAIVIMPDYRGGQETGHPHRRSQLLGLAVRSQQSTANSAAGCDSGSSQHPRHRRERRRLVSNAVWLSRSGLRKSSDHTVSHDRSEEQTLHYRLLDADLLTTNPTA